MGLSLLTNSASIAAQRNLNNTQQALSQNMERLSSGLRINQGADDPAGLAISMQMQAQIGGLQQASQNANDGVSMIQVADGAMNQQGDILNRLRDLAVQAANGTLGATDRADIDTERSQLVDEFDRISNVTEFNGVHMLGADAGSVSMQVGTNNTANDQISVTFNATDSTTLGVNALDFTTAAGAQSALDTIDTAISTLATDRAGIGASQNRLQVTMNNLSVATQNLSDANSRISDVDVASETAAMTRNQILSQAGTAVLAQANQLPQAALQLLKG